LPFINSFRNYSPNNYIW